jgi:hypothetical protein
VNANAWNLYDSHQAEASVAKFGESSEWQSHTVWRHTDPSQHTSQQKTSSPRCSPYSPNEISASRSHHIVHGHRYDRHGCREILSLTSHSWHISSARSSARLSPARRRYSSSNATSSSHHGTSRTNSSGGPSAQSA